MKIITILLGFLLWGPMAQAQVPTSWDMLSGNYPKGKTFQVEFKYGTNGDIDTGTDPEDVWLDSIYAWLPDSGKTLTFSSSSVSDSGILVRIEGLDTTGQQITENVNCVGTTKATTTNRYFRVNRAYCVDDTALVGTFYLYTAETGVSAGVPTHTLGVVASIAIGDNQTQQIIYTVPKYDYNGKAFLQAYLKRWTLINTSGSVAAGEREVELSLRTRSRGMSFRTRSAIGSNNRGGTAFTDDLLYINLPPLTDIIATADGVNGDNTKVWVNLGIILFGN